jgi:hypothetical protein
MPDGARNEKIMGKLKQQRCEGLRGARKIGGRK